MNINSLISGFILGFLCAAAVFAAAKIKPSNNSLNGDEIRDMSYYGRISHL